MPVDCEVISGEVTLASVDGSGNLPNGSVMPGNMR